MHWGVSVSDGGGDLGTELENKPDAHARESAGPCSWMPVFEEGGSDAASFGPADVLSAAAELGRGIECVSPPFVLPGQNPELRLPVRDVPCRYWLVLWVLWWSELQGRCLKSQDCNNRSPFPTIHEQDLQTL